MTMRQLKYKTVLNLILVFSIFSILFAFYVEYILGHKPCNLCLLQRLPYIATIIALTMISGRLSKNNSYVPASLGKPFYDSKWNINFEQLLKLYKNNIFFIVIYFIRISIFNKFKLRV